MKSTFLAVYLFITNLIFGQVFYKAANDRDFKEMIKNGVTYMPSGNSNTDNAYIYALRQNWKATDLKIFDSEKPELFTGGIVITEAYIDGSERVLSIVNFGYFQNKDKNRLSRPLSKYVTIGYILINGFNLSADEEAMIAFSEQTIRGLNDGVEIIKNNNIKKNGVSLYKEIHDEILPRAKVLQTKTLLIADVMERYIDLKALTKKGIKYKVISHKEYASLKKDELSNYCLMYFARNSYTEISIYDLENNDLIYTRHFASAKYSFSSSDISKIAKLWK